MDTSLQTSLQALLDRAIADGVAPGLTAIVFDRSSNLAEVVSGVKDVITKAPVEHNTIWWMASSSKLAMSLVTLALAEKKGLGLDSHEELVKVLPELGKDWAGSQIWKIFDRKDDTGAWKYKEAKVGITLRHILTHTSGYATFFNSPEYAWLLETSGTPFGSIAACNCPRLYEAGTQWSYGTGVEWLSVLIARLSGTSMRRAFQDVLFTPLNIAPNTLDIFRTPSMDANRSTIAYRAPGSSPTDPFIPLPFPFDTPQFEDVPPQDLVPTGSGPVWGTAKSYARVLQSVLNATATPDGEQPILSQKMWATAKEDAVGQMGIELPYTPFLKSTHPGGVEDIETWILNKDPESQRGLGWSLLQTTVTKELTASGLEVGALGWSGITNSFYSIDIKQGWGFLLIAQFFPWGSPAMLKLRDECEKLIVASRAAA
ncbi:hypothetical protein RQP46_007940 [Phenoliferia psychrophenolica]